MSLIDTSYFIGDLDIAGLSSSHVRARVEAFIDKYEPKFLRLLFGELLYADYVAGIALTGEENEAEKALWTILQSENLKQAIACYVYYYWLRDKETLTTSQGESKPQTENSTQANSIHKQVRAWNEMVENVGIIYNYLDLNYTLYTNWAKSYRYYFHDGYATRQNHFQPINSMNL